MKYIKNSTNDFYTEDLTRMFEIFESSYELLKDPVAIEDSPSMTDEIKGKYRYFILFDYYFIYNNKIATIIDIKVIEDESFGYINYEKLIENELFRTLPDEQTGSIFENIDYKNTKLYKHIESIYNDIHEDLKSYRLLQSLS